MDARPIIKGWNKDQITQKKEECEIWWNEYKDKLQNFTKGKITS